MRTLLLSARRSELGRRFFRLFMKSDSCLHDLLPQRRDSDIIFRLRRHTAYPIPRTRTNKYRSFIHFARLNVNNIKYKQTYNILCALYSCVYVWIYMWMWTWLLLRLDTKDCNLLFLVTDFYMYIVFIMCCIVLSVVACIYFISFSLSGYRFY